MLKHSWMAVAWAAAYIASPMALAVDSAATTTLQARIVDTAGVQAAIKRGAIVWDVRAAEEYKKGHIPGALNIGDIGKTLRKDTDEDYIPLAEMEKLLSGAGIDPGKEIVVYGHKGNPFVYFGMLTVEYLNGKQGHIYHGGIEDWQAAGNALDSEPAKVSPITLKLTVNPEITVSTQEVVAASKRKDVQILDVRSKREYSGEDIRAIRGGHIPGALNISFEQNWVDPETPAKLAKKQVGNKDGLALKSQHELQQLYAALDPSKETIVYCQSGVRAAETATVLKDLGFKHVKVYDSSWLGYGNTLDAPAENVQFFNVGALNGKLTALQKRIDSLEKALAEAKAGKP